MLHVPNHPSLIANSPETGDVRCLMQVKAAVRGVKFKGVTVEHVPSLRGCVEGCYFVKRWPAAVLHNDLLRPYYIFSITQKKH